MNNTLIFLRHGKTVVDKATPISEWGLSVEAQKQAEDIAANTFFHDVDVIVLSTEKKAFDTAKPLIDRLTAMGKKFELIYADEIREMDRDKSEIIPHEEYEEAVHEALTNPEKSIRGWEKAGRAHERFTSKVGEIDMEHRNRKILFVGHAYTINMFFADRLKEKDVYKLYKTNKPGEWGVIEKGEVKPIGYHREWIGERMV